MAAGKIPPLDFNTYQRQARTTALYPRFVALPYVALGICGEAGEVAEKIKKMYRDHGGNLTDQQIEEIAKELGDVLWYVSMMAWELGLSFGDVAQMNLDKLADRAERDAIHGDGDGR